jgi:hypothetical protein
MWELESPHISFGNLPGVTEQNTATTSVLQAIITENKWNSYSALSQKTILDLEGTSGLSIFHNIEVPDPNSTENKIKVKIIRFTR